MSRRADNAIIGALASAWRSDSPGLRRPSMAGALVRRVPLREHGH